MEITDLDAEPDGPQDDLSPSERRMVRAMMTADSARTGVVVLRVIAGVAAAASIVGIGISVIEFDRGDDGFGGTQVGIPNSRQVGLFLAQIASPLAFAGLLFAASYLLAVYASRLDMDIVLADEAESESRER